MLLISELVTNACNASATRLPHADHETTVTQTLLRHPDHILIEVSDPDPTPPSEESSGFTRIGPVRNTPPFLIPFCGAAFCSECYVRSPGGRPALRRQAGVEAHLSVVMPAQQASVSVTAPSR